MYTDVKSCITYNYCKSDYFNCDMGVRQGENLSPEKRHSLSFNIAVNNLPRQLRIVIGRKFFGSSGLPLLRNDTKRRLTNIVKFIVQICVRR
jgi:hypothetical protein